METLPALRYALKGSFHVRQPFCFLAQVFRTASSRKPQSKASIQFLPNELLLEIFSFLELKSYIICHGVCKKWNKLLPSTQMDPIRERLFELYRQILNTPSFEEPFKWTDTHLQPFDREEYIKCLLSQYPVIPEEFRMWILEWPARMAIQCTWPGLPFLFCVEHRPIMRRHGVNWIAYRSSSPQLSALVYKLNTPSQTTIPALLLWRAVTTADWLCVAQDEPDLFGRVLRNEYRLASIPEILQRDDNASDDSALLTFEDWIDYLEDLWDCTSRDLRYQRRIFPDPDFSIQLPVFCRVDSQAEQVLPAPSWSSSSTS